MTKTLTAESLLLDIKTSGTYAMTALINAYLGDQPITAQIQKNLWDMGRFIDNNGRLMPLTKAAIAMLLEQPEWRDHPMVVAALKLRVPEKSVDEAFLDKVEKDIQMKPYATAELWLTYYSGQPAHLPYAFFEDFIDDEKKLKPYVIIAMDRMVRDGKAMSREVLGLTPVHEVRIAFPTAEAATAFLAKWRNELGEKIAAATKRLAGRKAA